MYFVIIKSNVILQYSCRLHQIGCYYATEIKPGCMGWAGYVACIGEMRNSYKMLVENLKNSALEVLNVAGRVILKPVVRVVGCDNVDWVAESCEDDSEPLDATISSSRRTLLLGVVSYQPMLAVPFALA
jgi:hypothetical protein